MSYRTFKRVLGETSLERKCRWWFGISLAVMLLLSFTWYGTQTDKLVDEGNRELGRELVRAGLLELHLKGLGKQDSVYPEFYEEFVVEASRRLQLGREFEWDSIPAPAVQSTIATEDPFERNLVETWNEQRIPVEQMEEAEASAELQLEDAAVDVVSGVPNHRVVRTENGERRYQYYHPVYAVQSCIDCHQEVYQEWPNVQPGQLVAVARVEIDHQPTVNAQATNRALAWTTAVIVGLLAWLSLWAIIRYVIAKPVTHLRDVANAVRAGDTDQRAMIRTGDEFEELAAAFNRMVRQLLSQQDELRHVNTELDERLDELAEANMRLFEMNRVKSDFLATVSHELRTPLNSILGFSDVLSSIDALSDKQKRYVVNIRSSGRVLLEMINDILDLAKMESGRMEVKLSEFPIGSLVAAQCDIARPLSERKNIDLQHTVAAGLPTMQQDQAKLQQILNNLLSNAIKFTPEGGRIRVSAERDRQGDLRLMVKDSGVGISEEDQAIIFEKFRQGASASPGGDAMTREYSGTGLGLSIVRELCRLLGGEVTLQSALGKGSTFTVHLPWKLHQSPRIDGQLQDDLADLNRKAVHPAAWKNGGPPARAEPVAADQPSSTS